MRFALILGFMLCAAPAYATLTLVGSCAAVATSCTPTTVGGNSFATGDYVYEFAYRSATTAPTLGTGFTALHTASASVSSFRSGCQVMTSSTPPSATWTNATLVVQLVYSGANASATANCATPGTGVGGGTLTGTSGTTSTYTITGVGLYNATGIDFVIGAVGSSAATCIPGTLTSEVTTTNAIGFDSNGGVTAFATGTCTGTAGNWKSDTVDLLATKTTNAVQCGSASSTSVTTNTVTLSGTTAGNVLVATGMSAGLTGTLSFSDGTNTWATIQLGNLPVSDGSQAVGVAYNIAGGSAPVKLTTSSAGTVLNINVCEFAGLTTSNPVDQSNIGISTASTVATGNVTTTQATEILVSAGASYNNVIVLGNGVGWQTESFANTFSSNSLSTKVVAATGTYSNTYTNAGATTANGAIIVTLKKAVAPAGGCNPTMGTLGVSSCG